MKYMQSAAQASRNSTVSPDQIHRVKWLGVLLYTCLMFSLCVAHHIVYEKGHMFQWAIVIVTANLAWCIM